MLPWLQNPHSHFVIAAYAIALTALVGLALVSWLWARRLDRKWRLLHRERRAHRHDA